MRHVFLRNESSSSLLQSTFPTDLDIDDSGSDFDSDHFNQSTHKTSDSFDGETYCSTDSDNTSHGSSSVPFTVQESLSPSFIHAQELDTSQPPRKGKEPKVPRGVIHISSALRETVEAVDRAVDCSLIEVQVVPEAHPNMVSYDPSDSTKKVRITRPADMIKIPLSGTQVVVATSSRPVSGRLYKTLAYIKPPCQREVVAVYPLHLDEDMSLEAEGCDSAVIQLKGSEVDMFGHVVFGVAIHAGTAVAYILPIDTIIDDITKVLKLLPLEELSLHPGPQQGPRVDGGMRIEFASPKFYRDMEEVAIPKKHVLRGLRDKLVVKVGNARALLKAESRIEVEVAQPYYLERLFFRLTPELRDQVIEFLDF